MDVDSASFAGRVDLSGGAGEEICSHCGAAVRLEDAYCPACQEPLSIPPGQDDLARLAGDRAAARSLLLLLTGIAVTVALLLAGTVALVAAVLRH